MGEPAAVPVAALNDVFAAGLREWRPRFHTNAPLVERAE